VVQNTGLSNLYTSSNQARLASRFVAGCPYLAQSFTRSKRFTLTIIK